MSRAIFARSCHCGHAATLCEPCATRASAPVVPLSFAALCIDCDAVFQMGPSLCPSCGSREHLSLSRALDGRREHRLRGVA